MVDMHLEVDIIPVSDVDRAKQFYQRLGWRLDDDVAPLGRPSHRPVTPLASVTVGQGLTTAAPGSAEGGLIVSDIEAAHDELTGRGIDASEIWHGPPFPAEARQPGPDPGRTSYGSFFSSTTRTATPGWSRRSPRGSQAGSTPQARRSRPPRTWPARPTTSTAASNSSSDKQQEV